MSSSKQETRLDQRRFIWTILPILRRLISVVSTKVHPSLLPDIYAYTPIEGLEEARHAISANCELRFDTIHSSFVEKLSSSRTKDQAFFESINNTASAFNTSLDEEQIETTFIRGGKNITEIVNIGQRLEMFKKSIHKDAIKLENYWREWEEIQNDFIELGVNVFGPEAFGQEITDQKPGGYGRSMELLDLEHKEREAELEEEAEELKGNMLKKMRVSDKVRLPMVLPIDLSALTTS